MVHIFIHKVQQIVRPAKATTSQTRDTHRKLKGGARPAAAAAAAAGSEGKGGGRRGHGQGGSSWATTADLLAALLLQDLCSTKSAHFVHSSCARGNKCRESSQTATFSRVQPPDGEPDRHATAFAVLCWTMRSTRYRSLTTACGRRASTLETLVSDGTAAASGMHRNRTQIGQPWPWPAPSSNAATRSLDALFCDGRGWRPIRGCLKNARAALPGAHQRGLCSGWPRLGGPTNGHSDPPSTMHGRLHKASGNATTATMTRKELV